MPRKKFLVLLFVFMLTGLGCSNKQLPFRVHTNQEFIEGVRTEGDFLDIMLVFEHVLSSLADDVTVYPTENFFYFEFTYAGREAKGAFRFPLMRPESIEFGYYDLVNYKRDGEGNGAFRKMTEADGVRVISPNRFLRKVTYKGIKRNFHMYEPGFKKPIHAKLGENEKYLGPVMDESGLAFHFVFNKTKPHLMYLLNEDAFTSELFNRVSDKILVGTRSKFAFYDDKENNRRILFGVDSVNVKKNNYYDGPFDQLPDNYIEQSQLGKHMELAYPYYQGRIDKYGNIAGMEKKGARVAVTTYRHYKDIAELKKITEYCEENSPEKEDGTFYNCLTSDSK